jgi:hypothetical protein
MSARRALKVQDLEISPSFGSRPFLTYLAIFGIVARANLFWRGEPSLTQQGSENKVLGMTPSKHIRSSSYNDRSLNLAYTHTFIDLTAVQTKKICLLSSPISTQAGMSTRLS